MASFWVVDLGLLLQPTSFQSLADSHFGWMPCISMVLPFPRSSGRHSPFGASPSELRIRSALHRGGNPMKRAVLYTRVSTFDQNPERKALDLRRLAQRREFEVVH